MKSSNIFEKKREAESLSFSNKINLKPNCVFPFSVILIRSFTEKVSKKFDFFYL